MIPAESPSRPPVESLTSSGYEITVDEGRDTFFALQIAVEDNEDAWLMSDTVCALENMR